MTPLENEKSFSGLISIVIPVYNEEGNIDPLYAEIQETFAGAGWAYEIIWVDDRSTDRSFDILERLASLDDHNQVLRLRRNMGQTQAMAAGLSKAGEM